MAKKRLEFDIKKENTRIEEWNANYAEHRFEWTTLREDKIREGLEKKKKEGAQPITESGGRGIDIQPPTTDLVTSTINDNVIARKELDNDFLSHNSGYTKADLDALASKYDQNPNLDLKDNELRDYLNTRRELDHDVIRNGNLLKGATEASAPIDAELDKVYKTQPGIVDPSGREIYTAKELILVGRDLEKFKTAAFSPGFAGTNPSIYDSDAALKKYGNTKYAALANAYIKRYTFSNMSPIDTKIINRANELQGRIRPAEDKLIKQKLDVESAYLADKLPEYMTTRGTLSKNNEADMEIVNQLISQSMNPPVGFLDVTSKKEWNAAKVTSWRDDPKIKKNLDYRIIKNGNGTGELKVAHGTEQYTIPLSQTTFAKYFPNYAMSSPVDGIKRMIMSSPSLTTNVLKKGDATNAGFTGYDLPLLKDTNYAAKVKYDIEGRRKNIGGPLDGYQVRVYVFDDEDRIWKSAVVNQRGYINEDVLQDAINGVGSKTIESILKQ